MVVRNQASARLDTQACLVGPVGHSQASAELVGRSRASAVGSQAHTPDTALAAARAVGARHSRVSVAAEDSYLSIFLLGLTRRAMRLRVA
jgi:hypothetical protein